MGSYLEKLSERKEFGIGIAFICAFVVFSLFGKNFLTTAAFTSILITSAELCIVAIPATLLLTSGEIDLSVGAVSGFCAYLLGLLFLNYGVNPWIAVCIVVGVSLGIGFLNGIITIKTHATSVIITLATMMFWRGMIHALSGGYPIVAHGDSIFLSVFGGAKIYGIQTSLFWLIAVIIVFYYILENTRLGNRVISTGGNPVVAKGLGININKIKIMMFALTALGACITGIIQFGRIGSVYPVAGTGLEFEVIAAIVIGGTALAGGVGSVIGTLLGGIMMSMIRVGLLLMGAPGFWYRSFVGLVIIIVVFIHCKVRMAKK